MPETALVTGHRRHRRAVRAPARAARLRPRPGRPPRRPARGPRRRAADRGARPRPATSRPTPPRSRPGSAELGVDVDLLVNNAGFGTSGPLHRARPGARRRAGPAQLRGGRHPHPRLPARRWSSAGAAASSTSPPPPACSRSPTRRSTRRPRRSHSASPTPCTRSCAAPACGSLAVNPGPVPTEWQQVAGYESGRVGVVPGQIPAEQVVRESLAAYDRGRRSVIPGRAIRWFMRVTRPSPRAVQLRVTERIYRPKD